MVLPGSLDYLYYNGILDHIPYEAYEMTPMTPSGMAQMSGMGTGYGMNTGHNTYKLRKEDFYMILILTQILLFVEIIMLQKAVSIQLSKKRLVMVKATVRM